MTSTLTLSKRPAPRRASSGITKPRIALTIGRFQMGPHPGHMACFRKGLEIADHLIIAVGSANGARTAHRDPFTYEERRHAIEACLSEADRQRTTVVPIGDHLYDNDGWMEEVQRTVRRVAEATVGTKAQVVLVGHEKDGTSFYLRMFPDWPSDGIPNVGEYSSTHLREAFLDDPTWIDSDAARNALMEPVRAQMSLFAKGPIYADLVEDRKAIQKYQRDWGKGPHITTDTCVIQSGHVLLVKRIGRPSKGLWALPGGFLNMEKNETLVQGAIRELVEETNIRLGDGRPEVVSRILRGSIKASETFDAPFRDPRGRMFTHCYLIALENRSTFPEVTPQLEEVSAVKWVALGDLRESQLAFDHYHIIHRMKGLKDRMMAY